MKTLLLALSLFLVHSVSQAKMSGVSCREMGRDVSFSAIFQGGRFADMLGISLDSEDIAGLVRSVDKGAEIINGHLGINMQMGSCARGTGNVLLECKMAENTWGLLNLSYKIHGQESEGFSQTISFAKSLDPKVMDISLVKNNKTISLEADLVMLDENKNEIRLPLHKKLGEVSGAFDCTFDKE
jgi:hypothetical protein